MIQLIELIKTSALLNFDIVTANNGQQAVELYQTYHQEIKLILMDIQMPVLNGYEASIKIRDLERSLGLSTKVHIVALSGDSTSEHERQCRLAGINESRTKPITRCQLEQLVAVFN